MKKIKACGWSVDIENDFMKEIYEGQLEGEGLYVPGAKDIIKNVEAITDYLRKNKIPRYGSVDAHPEDDPEFELFGGRKHCVIGHPGQKEINEILNKDTVYIPRDKKVGLDELTGLEIILEKATPNVFDKEKGNVNADLLVQEYVNTAVVYGVATDICVLAAVKGLRERGVEVYVVKDAIKGLDKSAEAIEEMKGYGARFVTTKKVSEGKVI